MRCSDIEVAVSLLVGRVPNVPRLSAASQPNSVALREFETLLSFADGMPHESHAALAA